MAKKPNVQDSVKVEVETRATEFVEKVLKPIHVKPPLKEPQFNYIVDLWAKWYRGYFYFGATYASPGPDAISQTFETKFARMEFVGDGCFDLSYMRHNGKWFELFPSLSLDECLEAVRDQMHFMP